MVATSSEVIDGVDYTTFSSYWADLPSTLSTNFTVELQTNISDRFLLTYTGDMQSNSVTVTATRQGNGTVDNYTLTATGNNIAGNSGGTGTHTVIIENVAMNSGDGAFTFGASSAFTVTAKNSYFDIGATSSATPDTGSITFENCVFESTTRFVDTRSDDGGGVTFTNCLVVLSSVDYGFLLHSSNRDTVQGTGVFGSTTRAFLDTNGTGDYNIVDDASGTYPGSNNQGSVTYTATDSAGNKWVVEALTTDYRLKSVSNATQVPQNFVVSGGTSTDAIGTAVSGTYRDCGPYEFVEAGGATPTLPNSLMLAGIGR